MPRVSPCRHLEAVRPSNSEDRRKALSGPLIALTDSGLYCAAGVSGLVSPGIPHAGKSAKQLQASSGLFYEVFREYDPENLLLHQARREVLERQFEGTRLLRALNRIAGCRIVLVEPPRPTPLSTNSRDGEPRTRDWESTWSAATTIAPVHRPLVGRTVGIISRSSIRHSASHTIPRPRRMATFWPATSIPASF